MNDKINDYRNGRTAADDPALLADKDVTREMARQWESVPDELDEPLRERKQEIWDHITAYIKVQKTEARLTLYRRFCVAASILVVLLAGYSAFLTGEGTTTTQHSLSTGNQNKQIVMLEDGTRVTLGPNSNLRYPDLFGGKDRKVTLDGQAFFEVAADASRPFSVNINGVDITALGTTFEIFSPTDKRYVEAILQTGKIRVDYPDNHSPKGQGSQIILPNHKLTFDSQTQKASVVTTDASKYSEWSSRSGQSFKNEKLQFIIPRLERWYGIDIRFDPQLCNRNDRFTFKITDESLDHILGLMQKSSGVKWHKDEASGQYRLY